MKSSRLIGHFVDKINILSLLWAFLAICGISAVLFFILGMYGHGLEYAARPRQVSFFDSLYFSIVTISSLGYGDIHPVSYSKAIACTEVILGLVIIGLVISKVASERTGYLLRRIYSSDVQKRLKYFSDSIYDFNNGLSEDTRLNDED